MSTLKFLQLSDLHLDSSLASSRLNLPPEKRARINKDIERSLARAVEIAAERRVDVLLCPGDLWDDESISFAGAAFIFETLASLAPIPVVVAPGNHDPLHAFSYHDSQYFRAKAGHGHPKNVTIFNSPRIERRTLPSLPDVDFYGCCFEANVPRSDRALAGIHPARTGALSVLVFHGSLDDGLPGDADRPMTAPFSRQELLDTGFDYAALGHYHRASDILDHTGRVRGAYGGAPVPRGLDESGEWRGFLLAGEIGPGGIVPGTLERIPVASRRILRAEATVDSTIRHAAAAQQRIADALAAAGARHDDIVHIVLQGRTHPEVTRFEFDDEWMQRAAFHLSVDQSRLEPEHDIDAMLRDATAGKRIEGQFVARMKELMEQADDDPDHLRMLREAMCLGLDALHGREVKPRHVY